MTQSGAIYRPQIIHDLVGRAINLIKRRQDFRGIFLSGQAEWRGPKRPDNSPVDCCQRRPGGSPGHRYVDPNSAERSEAEGEQSLDCRPKPALPRSGVARGVQSKARTEKTPKDVMILKEEQYKDPPPKKLLFCYP